MAAYATHSELEDRMGIEDFSNETIPTDTQVDAMFTELSAMWDGLSRQAEGTETPAEYVKQAVLSAGVYQIEQIRFGSPVDVREQMKIMKEFLTTNIKSTTTHYEQTYPDSSGKW